MRGRTGRLFGAGLLCLLVVLVCVGLAPALAESMDADKQPWWELDDAGFAAWLTDEANTETVKDILRAGSGTEYTMLNTCIGDLRSNGNESIQQVDARIVALRKDLDSYIYFDLAAGNVEIGGPNSGYKGYVYVGGNKTEVKGPYNPDNKYYIYQSTDRNRSETGYTSGNFDAKTGTGTGCRVPAYDRVKTTVDGEEKLWTDYITNNTDVKAVSTAWEEAAPNFDRTATQYRITFKQESNYIADVTIDNIWSSHHVENRDRHTGGIAAHLYNCGGTTIQLQLKGDNRVGNVHYNAAEGKGNKIIFSNGEVEPTQGSITVADFTNNMEANYWCAAIGGNDAVGTGHADGIVIKSGVIYAGTTSADNCTAIGGGGNEFGGVTIEGGTVTAVSASTGTAIGGGIGWGNKGGDADVTINGGTVYAYNHGIGPDSGSYKSFVPAAAIGGGSANTNTGNDKTTVTITGGFVYAQSVAGTAIGGGSSSTKNGGDATVNISGGTVIAKSIGREVKYNKNNNKNHTETVTAGTSIGGGTGGTGRSNGDSGSDVEARGGSVTLKISQASDENPTILRTGSIGGGETHNDKYKIGSATVNITGGDISGQVVMAGGASENCTFTMSGGKIHGTDVTKKISVEGIADPNPSVQIEYIRNDGGAVWIEDPKGVATITGGTIENCKARLGGAVYMEGGTFTMTGGTVGKNTAIGTNNDGLGGGVCVYGGEVRMNGGTISGNHAKDGGGMYVNAGDVTVVKGGINYNEATENGGGICIVATEGGKELSVKMLSGSLSGNTAGNNGGGMVVEGNGQQKVTVEIGCMLDHKLTNPEPPKDPKDPAELPKPQLPIEYIKGVGGDEYDYSKYANYCDVPSQHDSCPELRENSAEKIGGAIHIDCASATLNFYCMNESGNKTAGGTDEPAIQVDGGTVNVGDEVYHNDQYNEEHGKGDHSDYTLTSARGYISIKSNVLVQAGKVNVYGSLTNPKMDHIVAKIEVSDNDLFIDHRFSRDKDVYWLRYNENFNNGTGFVSYDYSVFDKITVWDAPDAHDGYIFRGWCTASEYDEYEESEPQLYQPGEEISKKEIQQIHKEAEETVYCDKCKEYIEGHLKVLYGIWDRLYTLKVDEDESVRNAVNGENGAWEITYIKSAWNEDEKEFVPVPPEEEVPPPTLGEETVEMLTGSQVTFTPKEGSSDLPLTLTFKDDDTGNQVVESLERMANKGEYTIHVSDSDSFKVTVTESGGVYTLTMPKKHVTISSVWELYLDYGTIELFKNGFRQQEYLPYHLDDDNAVNAWKGDYRIWQCEDNNQGDPAKHTSYTGDEGAHEFHSTDNVLQLNDDLRKWADSLTVDRKITLGNLNISKEDSIALIDGAQATLTQTGELKAKNILVPERAGLTLTSSALGPTVSLEPASGYAAIGRTEKGGSITLQNVKLRVEAPGDGDNAYVVNGADVNLTNCHIGSAEAPVKGKIHAATSLKITKTQIYQQ